MAKSLRDIVKKPSWARSKTATEYVNKNPVKVKNDRPTEHEGNFKADYVPVYDRSSHHQGVNADADVTYEEADLNEGIKKFFDKALGFQARRIHRKASAEKKTIPMIPRDASGKVDVAKLRRASSLMKRDISARNISDAKFIKKFPTLSTKNYLTGRKKTKDDLRRANYPVEEQVTGPSRLSSAIDVIKKKLAERKKKKLKEECRKPYVPMKTKFGKKAKKNA